MKEEGTEPGTSASGLLIMLVANRTPRMVHCAHVSHLTHTTTFKSIVNGSSSTPVHIYLCNARCYFFPAQAVFSIRTFLLGVRTSTLQASVSLGSLLFGSYWSQNVFHV